MRGSESTPKKPEKKEQERYFLVGSRGDAPAPITTCPSATTLTGYSMSMQRWLIVAVTCKRWGCKFCGPCRVRQLAAKTMGAKPTTLITLTVNPGMHVDPRAAFNATRRKLPVLSRTIRKTVKEFEYLRVLEVTKKGWPHYHLVARTGYIPQRDLSGWWAELTGAPIVDIRKLKKSQDAYWYVVKYLSKQEYIPWTNRRVTMSKNFARKDEEEKFEPLNLEEIERHSMDPASYLFYECQGRVIERISPLLMGYAQDGKKIKREIEAKEKAESALQDEQDRE